MTKQEIIEALKGDSTEGLIQMKLYQRIYEICWWWDPETDEMSLTIYDHTGHYPHGLYEGEDKRNRCINAFISASIWGPARKTFEQIREPDSAELVDESL